MSFVIVDYCKGNLRSVQKGLELAGADARISASVNDIINAEAIVLPGVGSFADASMTMQASGQMEAIRMRLEAGVPFLGICLGMQLLFECGDEGMPKGRWAEGLGIMEGHSCRIDRFDNKGRLHKVPHVGWNQVRYTASPQSESALELLFAGIEDCSNFYFTHSYQVAPAHSRDVIAEVTHAATFASAVAYRNVYGVQFHPEKSSHKGLLLLRNFVASVHAS